MATPLLELPKVPVDHGEFIEYLTNTPGSVRDLVEPYLAYESKLREIFAQQPDHPVVQETFAGLVPIFNGHEDEIKIRARNIKGETKHEREKYLMPLLKDDRKKDGVQAIVGLEVFKKNFSIFSEGWSYMK